MKWARLAELRNHTLEKFLEDISSKEEALKKFADTQIEDPPYDEINAYFERLNSVKSFDLSTESQSAETDANNIVAKSVVTKKTKNATGTV